MQNIRRENRIGELFDVWLQQLKVRAAHTPGDPAALDGDMTIEALPTWYADTVFRSALEANWAATLDSLGIAWEYEPRRFDLPSGATYLPDFHLPELGTWIEVKGTGVPRVEKAAELAQMLACACGGACSCEWPGGELVLVGHPPTSYDPWAEDYSDTPAWVMRHWARRHPGHPSWSTPHGRPARLYGCLSCGRRGWTRLQAPVSCRGCRAPIVGLRLHDSGDTALEFVSAECRPRPPQTAA